MVGSWSAGGVDEVLSRLEAELDELSAAVLTGCVDDEVLEVWQRMERIRRRLAPIDHSLINELEARSVAFTKGCVSTAVLARHTLRIHPGEASARVRAAKALGQTLTPTGVRLAPIFPAVAAAQAAGQISDRHAQVIVAMIEKLPDAVRADKDRAVEDWLVGFAAQHDPLLLAQHARDLANALDQDGQYKDLEPIQHLLDDLQRLPHLEARMARVWSGMANLPSVMCTKSGLGDRPIPDTVDCDPSSGELPPHDSSGQGRRTAER